MWLLPTHSTVVSPDQIIGTCGRARPPRWGGNGALVSSPQRSAPAVLVSRYLAQQAELVPFDVGKDDMTLVIRDYTSAQCEKARDFRTHITGAEVKMDTVLAILLLRHTLKEEPGTVSADRFDQHSRVVVDVTDAQVRQPLDLGLVIGSYAVTVQHLRPEPRHSRGHRAIHHHVTEGGHPWILAASRWAGNLRDQGAGGGGMTARGSGGELCGWVVSAAGVTIDTPLEKLLGQQW